MKSKVRITNRGMGLHVNLSKDIKGYSTPFEGKMRSMSEFGINLITFQTSAQAVHYCSHHRSFPASVIT